MTAAGELPTSHRRPGASWKGPLLAGLSALMAIAIAVALVYPAFRHTRNEADPTADGVVGLGTVNPSSAAATSPSASASPTPSHSTTPRASRSTPRAGSGSTRSGGRPGASNTGPIAGTKLTTVNGDQTYSKAGQVIQNVDIHGYVRITAKNVVIRNAIVRGGAVHCNASAVIEIEFGASATIEDTEIRPDHPSACLDGIWATAVTLTRVNIHGTVDGMKADDNTTVQDSWIHDLSAFASDPNQGGGPTHNDGIQTLGGHHIIVRHNTISVGAGANAAYQVTQDAGTVGDVTVQSNFLDGGSCTLNFAHKGGSSMTGISVTGNRFGRHTEFDCPIIISTKTTLSANSGNVYDDTGAAIPRPQQHD